MRIFVPVLCLLVFSFGFAFQKSKEITIDLKFVTIEKSKDSYTIIETWKLQKNTLTYSYTNNNKRKNISPKTNASNLMPADLDTLANCIRKNKLLVNVPAEKQNEYKNPYIAMNVTLIVAVGKEKGSIYLYELKNAMGGNVHFQHIGKLRSVLRKHLKA